MPTLRLAPDLPPVSRLCFGSSSDSLFLSLRWTVLFLSLVDRAE
jgi:hypothetical protein